MLFCTIKIEYQVNKKKTFLLNNVILFSGDRDKKKQEVKKEASISKRKANWWLSRINDGNFNLNDGERLGRSIKSDEN